MLPAGYVPDATDLAFDATKIPMCDGILLATFLGDGR